MGSKFKLFQPAAFEPLNSFYWLITVNDVRLFFWCNASLSGFALNVLI